MKTYRTIDLLKMAYDGKIFKNKFKNVENGEIIKQGNTKTVVFFNEEGANFGVGKSSSGYDFDNWLDEKWEEIPQPVSFIEAIESCKPIRVEHEYFCMHGNYAYTNHLLMKIGDILLPDQIKEVIRDGKWYIKEDGEETASTDKTKFIKINYKDLRDHERHTKYFSTQEEYEKWHEENWNDVVING